MVSYPISLCSTKRYKYIVNNPALYKASFIYNLVFMFKG